MSESPLTIRQILEAQRYTATKAAREHGMEPR